MAEILFPKFEPPEMGWERHKFVFAEDPPFDMIQKLLSPVTAADIENLLVDLMDDKSAKLYRKLAIAKARKSDPETTEPAPLWGFRSMVQIAAGLVTEWAPHLTVVAPDDPEDDGLGKSGG